MNLNIKYFLLIVVIFLIAGCSLMSMKAVKLPADTPALDYAENSNWVVMGNEDKKSINLSWPDYPYNQETARADVFYVHPTTLASLRVGNGIIDSPKQRDAEDEVTFLQASAFASDTRIWAPRYRQVSIGTYIASEDSPKVIAAYTIAYKDVLSAFDYYMEHYNQGRPIILAGHSQGSTMVVKILKERIEAKSMENKLVAAYIIGEFVGEDTFKSLKASVSENDTGCIISWVTVAEGGTPRNACGSATLSKKYSSPIHTTQTPICINPLTWSNMPTAKEDNSKLVIGSGPFNNKFIPASLSAWCDEGILRIDDEVNIPDEGSLKEIIGSKIKKGDYHEYDIPLFFGNIRENVAKRVEAYISKQSSKN